MFHHVAHLRYNFTIMLGLRCFKFDDRVIRNAHNIDLVSLPSNNSYQNHQNRNTND